MRLYRSADRLVCAATFFVACACSSSRGEVPVSPPATGDVIGAGSASGGATGSPTAIDGGVDLTPNGDVPDPGGGALYLTASGEELAVTGYAFPPANADATFLVDGWVFHLDRVLVTLDHVKLWSNPNTVPADQSQHGPLVAHLDGPWAIDLHAGGPIGGEGGGAERAVPFAAIKQRDDGSAFDTTLHYGFGFDTVASSANARNVNLDAAGLADYADMIAHGYSVLYVGTATHPDGESCNAGASPYDFSRLPKTLPFRLGFSTPTSYVNCQNGSEFPGVPGLNGEDYPRGVQFRKNGSVIGQVTLHADHPFWESFAEGSALRFDQIAARYVGVTSPVATIEDLRGADFTAFEDKAGAALPMRTCVGSDLYAPPYAPGQTLRFDPLKIPVKRSGDPKDALRDYYDYVRYTQSTQGHLNSQGLCFVSRNFPAPRGGS